MTSTKHKSFVWKKAAHIDPTILCGGKIIGTWRYDKTSAGRKLVLTASIFSAFSSSSSFSRSELLSSSYPDFDSFSSSLNQTIEGYAQRLAAFFGMDEYAVEQLVLERETKQSKASSTAKKKKKMKQAAGKRKHTTTAAAAAAACGALSKRRKRKASECDTTSE